MERVECALCDLPPDQREPIDQFTQALLRSLHDLGQTIEQQRRLIAEQHRLIDRQEAAVHEQGQRLRREAQEREEEGRRRGREEMWARVMEVSEQ